MSLAWDFLANVLGYLLTWPKINKYTRIPNQSTTKHNTKRRSQSYEQNSLADCSAYHKQTQKTNSTPRIQLQSYTEGISNKITNSNTETLHAVEVSRRVPHHRFWKYFYSQISSIIDSKLSQDYINSKGPLTFSSNNIRPISIKCLFYIKCKIYIGSTKVKDVDTTKKYEPI